MPIDVKYSIAATATGGREGTVRTADGAITEALAPPAELGGSGNGLNPEQYFTSGYAACYLGAMKFATGQDASLARVPDNAEVTATVGIGPRPDMGFGLTVDLKVHFPGVDQADVQKVADAGHLICPYSHATKGNISVTTTII